MNSRISISLVLIALGVAAIWYFSSDDQDRIQEVGDHGLFYPELIDQLNSVTKIRIQTFGTEYSLDLEDSEWQVSEYDGYPANPNFVSNFLVGFAQMRKIAPKTSDFDRLAELDLAGLDAADSGTVQVELLNHSEQALANLFIGKRRPSVRNVLLSEIYVRRPESNQTWLVESGLTIPVEAIDWLDTTIVNLDERVQKVTIESSGVAPVTVVRDLQDMENFTLTSVPENHKIRHQYRLNDIGELFRRLSFEDVKKVSDWNTKIEVSAVTDDNLLIYAAFGEGELQNFVQMSAAAKEQANQEVLVEAEEFNRRWDGWMFEVSDVRRGTAELTLHDLVEPDVGSKNE